jgi:hypothetical protein
LKILPDAEILVLLPSDLALAAFNVAKFSMRERKNLGKTSGRNPSEYNRDRRSPIHLMKVTPSLLVLPFVLGIGAGIVIGRQPGKSLEKGGNFTHQNTREPVSRHRSVRNDPFGGPALTLLLGPFKSASWLRLL